MDEEENKIKVAVEITLDSQPRKQRRDRPNAKNFSRTEEEKPVEQKPDLLLG